jgi:flagellar basal-body rod protein FlgB
MLEGIDLFRLAGARMAYLADRQKVISQNIANADTPGYRAQDLPGFSFASALLSVQDRTAAAPPLQLAATNPAHLTNTTSADGGPQSVAETHPYTLKPNGNTVSLEEQMVKANDTGAAFDLASTAYAKSVALLRSAIGSA